MHKFERGLILGIVLVVWLLILVIRKKNVGGWRYLVFMFAGWLVPGAGHLAGGRRARGLFYLIAIGGTFLAGLWLTNWRSVRFEDNPFYYAGQWGCGAIALVCHELLEPHRPPMDPLSWSDPGLLYICVAGLLNAVVVLNLLHLPGGDGRDAFGRAGSSKSTQ